MHPHGGLANQRSLPQTDIREGKEGGEHPSDPSSPWWAGHGGAVCLRAFPGGSQGALLRGRAGAYAPFRGLHRAGPTGKVSAGSQGTGAAAGPPPPSPPGEPLAQRVSRAPRRGAELAARGGSERDATEPGPSTDLAFPSRLA